MFLLIIDAHHSEAVQVVYVGWKAHLWVTNDLVWPKIHHHLKQTHRHHTEKPLLSGKLKIMAIGWMVSVNIRRHGLLPQTNIGHCLLCRSWKNACRNNMIWKYSTLTAFVGLPLDFIYFVICFRFCLSEFSC